MIRSQNSPTCEKSENAWYAFLASVPTAEAAEPAASPAKSVASDRLVGNLGNTGQDISVWLSSPGFTVTFELISELFMNLESLIYQW